MLEADRNPDHGIAMAVRSAAVMLEGAAAPGHRIGAYRIEKEIGSGGMGSVYLATRDDEQYQKKVAIKLIRRGMGHRRDAAAVPS